MQTTKAHMMTFLAVLIGLTACSDVNNEQREVDQNQASNNAVTQTVDSVKAALESGNGQSAGNIVTYSCDNGKSLQAEYINSQTSRSARLTYDGKSFDMYSTRAASGAKYATEQGLNAEDGLIWWSQRDEGMLMTMILDHSVNAEDYPIVTKCTEDK
jgi:membrane-bound inhibitor of C-type lysozyme